MRINFTARHFKAPERLKTHAEERVLTLKKYYDRIIDCDIVLDYEKETQVAEIAVMVYGKKLIVIEKSKDIYKSIDGAVEKLERKVKKYKEKRRDRAHEKGTDSEPSTLYSNE